MAETPCIRWTRSEAEEAGTLRGIGAEVVLKCRPPHMRRSTSGNALSPLIHRRMRHRQLDTATARCEKRSRQSRTAAPRRRSAAHAALCRRQPGKPRARRATHRPAAGHAPPDCNRWHDRRRSRALGETGSDPHGYQSAGYQRIEALKILRGDPATAHIPVVALSANAVPRDVQKGLEADFFRYLTKPIKVAEFMETLSAALDF